MTSITFTRAVVFLALGSLAASVALAASVQIQPSRDNTLYEDPVGSLSNGAGNHFFAGQTLGNGVRRGLVAFDIAGNVPLGATITDVSLTMNMSKTISGTADVSLHRVLADWGEGASDAPGEEGGGDAAAPGDATWLHRFSPGQFWLTAGGDFDPVASASTLVAGVQAYTWAATPAMLADVEDWLVNPSANFGWLVLGDEPSLGSAKRFDSRESSNPPVLTVTYDEPTQVPAVSPGGVALLALLLAAASAVALRRRVTAP